ncbi:PAS domain S-box protein [Desulfosporosinus sp. SB140]|uniref:PAS domain S-box protein n=1 Tax=Desulfosporosinus paludis TaxID=3115649 RepID=UPI00388FA5D4
MFRNLGLKTKILASIGLITLLSFSIVIYIVSAKSSEMAKNSAYQIAEESANKNGAYVKANLEIAMDTVRTLSYTFQQMKLSGEVDREMMDKILLKVLTDNPQFVATWTLWEPNALDGKDADYKNKPGNDETGRFIPYYSKQYGVVHLEPLVNYKIPGEGDYYLIPKETGRETIVEPYLYPIEGEEVMITSVVVPIMVDGRFVGVVGIDIALDTLQKTISKINPLEKGYACLLSNEGKYIAYNDSSKIGKIIEDSQAKDAIKLGKHFTTTKNGSYDIYIPITIGRTTTPWSMLVSVPLEEISEEAVNIRKFIILIGIVGLVFIGLIIFMVESKITNQYLLKEVQERQQIQEDILRLASIVESSDNGIIGLTLEGVIINWNSGAEKIYGYSKAEIIGRSAQRLIPPDRVLELEEILRRISEGVSLTHCETLRLKKDGQIIDVYLTVSPLKNRRGEISGASAIVRDVTMQKILEKEMTRMEQMNLIGEMAASIGHEVRNPMTTVRGFLQLLEANPASDKYSGYIPLMISELDRANSIITEFLSISRTKANEFARRNLNDILNSILPLLQMDAMHEDKTVMMRLEVIPDLDLDDKEIRQLVLNLARNGFEAMSEGGCLTIETAYLNDEVILSIQDEGTGISPEIIDRIGTPFLTTKEKGTGLGLAVCYGIAARHNATISVESSLKGSIFFVKFKAKSFDLN